MGNKPVNLVLGVHLAISPSLGLGPGFVPLVPILGVDALALFALFQVGPAVLSLRALVTKPLGVSGWCEKREGSALHAPESGMGRCTDTAL